MQSTYTTQLNININIHHHMLPYKMKELHGNINTSLATTGQDGKASHGHLTMAFLLQDGDKIRISGGDDGSRGSDPLYGVWP